MCLIGRHLLNSTDFSSEELYSLIKVAEDISAHPHQYTEICRGKIMASLFYEPSTRTRLSFDAAMKRLGGEVIGFSDPEISSHSKGESIQDTVKTVQCYSDIIVMRHPEPFVPHKCSNVLNIPLINAGDGANQHPTQTLADILTIYRHKQRLSNLKIGFCGDLKYGRTIHSLIKTMDRYQNNSFVCISLDNLKLPKEILKEIKSSVKEGHDFQSVMSDLDVIYMTRIQKERFPNVKAYEKHKGCYILTKEKMNLAKKDAIIMHPLPRVDEIQTCVDQDARAVYFKQARAGMHMRMALIMSLLGISKNQMNKNHDEKVVAIC